jgi:hypothetical protein
MGLFDELIQLIQEASNEGRPPQQRPVQSAYPPAAAAEQRQKAASSHSAMIPDQQEIRRRIQMQQRREAARQDNPKAQTAPEAIRPASIMRPAVPDAVAVVNPTHVTRAGRLSLMLHQRRTFADAILLKELLDKPLCMRGRMGRR